MEQEHRDAIQRNFTSLVERTDLESMVTALHEKGVFSTQMIEPYQNNYDSERDRKRKLYMDIKRRGPDAFRLLVEALGEMGYWDLVRDLDPDSPFSFYRHRTFTPTPKPKPAADDDNFRSLSSKNKPKPEPPKTVTVTYTPPPEDNDNASAEALATPTYVVKKSLKFMEDDDTKDLKLYRTRGRKRGVLVNFTYMQFDNDIEEFRNGVDVDCNNLTYLFSELGFRVVRYLNLTKQQTLDTLKSLNDVLEGVESVFIVVSSHGYKRAHTSDTDVRCKDGKLISLYDIMTYFNNTEMPGLVGVPKVFIFQMCRGTSAEYTWQAAGGAARREMPMPRGVAVDGRPEPPRAARGPRPGPAEPADTRTPLYSDILIAHSTLPGLVAHRDGKLGSWYIQALCEVFAERAHDCHVEKLFTLVDSRMQDKFKVQTSSVDRWGFNKRLYLHPGLYEDELAAP
ncbi:caspase Dronc [Trichoplusia ni]|uniref:Caspase Dronc n=1 Tax=Trichoplusia ni TaxID=7111 RepID=A0A2H4WW93_TRINI|nr:caspase Dronc [Trichoplusia ni]AUD12126.1 caspase-5/dronc [Trichoplusia ni]